MEIHYYQKFHHFMPMPFFENFSPPLTQTVAPLILVLKMRYQVLSFASEKVQGFPSDSKILMLLLSVLFHLQNRVSVF